MVGASKGDKARSDGTSLWVPPRYAEFLNDAGRTADGRPTLSFLHVLMPHAPWIALPDGQTYVPRGELAVDRPRS